MAHSRYFESHFSIFAARRERVFQTLNCEALAPLYTLSINSPSQEGKMTKVDPATLAAELASKYDKDELAALIASLQSASLSAPAPAAVTTSADTPSELTDNPILAKLSEFGLTHKAYMHEACMTAEELVEKVPLASAASETHTKNLLFKDKKHGIFLVTHATSTTMNTKQLGKLLKLEGKVNMRLADGKLLDELLGCQPGCVGPLSIVNDKEKKVTLVLDQALLDKFESIHSHPMRNDASIQITPQVLQDYLQKAGVEPAICLLYTSPSPRD